MEDILLTKGWAVTLMTSGYLMGKFAEYLGKINREYRGACLK